MKPQTLDTIVATNLHADILSDLAAALAGSLGIAPTANINPERDAPSMFEPIHGSAFDITGKGIANPVATFWTTSMMLEHLWGVRAVRPRNSLQRDQCARLAQPIIPVTIAKMKLIVPNQSKSPASVTRLAEMSGSLLPNMIGLSVMSATADDVARVRFLRASRRQGTPQR